MKHFTPYLSAALVALWLVPQTISADCNFTKNLFPGQATDRTEHRVSATVHVGEYGPQRPTNMTRIDPFASSDETVVKVYSNGGYDAQVFFVGAGTAQVTYTENVTRPEICSSLDTIDYTVEKGIPTLFFAGGDGMPVTEYTAAWSQSGSEEEGEGGEGKDEEGKGDGAAGIILGGADGTGTGAGTGSGSYVWTPSYYARYMTLSDDGRGNYQMVSIAIPLGELTFNSTNPDVATISASGQTTVKGLGTTVISVSWPGNANWEAGQASYTLNVKKAANIYFSPGLVTDTIDNVTKLNVVCPEGVTVNRWSSTNPAIASVDAEGNVTMKAVGGPIYIYAYFDGNDEYASAMCACQLTVAKKRPQIHFAQESIKLELNATPYVFPELIKPNDLTNHYSWRSTSTKVATVDNAGNITIVGAGYTQIQFLYDQGETKYDPKYLPDIARLNLTVTTSGLYIGDTYVMSSNPDVLGDSSVMYSEDNGETNLTLTHLNYNAGGGTFIRTTKSMNLNIYVVGNCHISNAAKAIETTGPLYIWCQNKKDSIQINATHTAIEAGGMKVIDCYLFATGGQYGIYTNTFAVWAGGYIFAEGNTEAIRTYSFQRGMADMGGIEVLTKGVTYVEGTSGGFFTDVPNKVKAKKVEIGKIPLPVSNDKVKDIDFDSENPYDNLDVVFSETKDDKFNDEDKQIELTTTNTDEKVDETSATNTTCSSDWLKALSGVLVFDVPEGKGKFEIRCELKEGFQLRARVEGKGAATINATTEGWATVEYNVAEQTHVIIYLQEVGEPKSAPKRAKAATKDEQPGATIKAIKITPDSAPTAIDQITDDKSQMANKVIRNNQLLIIRDGKTYNVLGTLIR